MNNDQTYMAAEIFSREIGKKLGKQKRRRVKMKREIYRPMRIVHGYFEYKSTDSYEEKYDCIRERFIDLKEKGYGGVVTNISFDNYMKDVDEWKLLEDKIQICKELGLRMWLYDEDCYPSGAAGTQTLDKNEDFEARGLVMVTHILAP